MRQSGLLALAYMLYWEGLTTTHRPLFIAGLGVDAVGAILVLVSLSYTPVSVVQPITAGGMVVLSLYAHFVLKETLTAFEWYCIALVIVGVVGIALTTTATDTPNTPHPPATLSASGVIFNLYLMTVMIVMEYIYNRPNQVMSIQEFASGTMCGVCFGVSAGVGRLFLSTNRQLLGTVFSLVFSVGGLWIQTR